MKIENFDVEEMFSQTGIAPVTTEAAFNAEKNPEAENEAIGQFQRSEPTLRAALILYRRTGMGSPLEFSVVRQIAERFFLRNPSF